MKAHQIKNGVVVNTIEVETLDVLPNLIEATEGGIGWSFDGTNWTAPPPPPSVPEPSSPTKEELLAQLQALQAQINALP